MPTHRPTFSGHVPDNYVFFGLRRLFYSSLAPVGVFMVIQP